MHCWNTLDFLDQVLERMSFSIQRIQTDRGQEFFAYNGKVKRTQRTDLDEFCSNVNHCNPELSSKLLIWEDYYNKQWVHSSLHGDTPWENKTLEKIIPSKKDIQDQYDHSKELFAIQNYKYDQEFKEINKQKNAIVSAGVWYKHKKLLLNASCQLIDGSKAKLYKPIKVICNIKKAQ